MGYLPFSILKNLPAANHSYSKQTILSMINGLNKKIIVLDDDPTGTQTVHNIPVYTAWNDKALENGFLDNSRLFFVLTNSRSLSEDKTSSIHKEIAERLCLISKKTGMDYLLISRSDSTLRGHYPLETETLRNTIELNSNVIFDGEIIIPFFYEGGRFTLNNIHYVKDADQLLPVAETDYAKDLSFPFVSSHLGEYVQEKTKGKYLKKDCIYIQIEDLRNGNIEIILQKLMQATRFTKIIVNACEYSDLEVVTMAILKAIALGKRYLFRSAASIVKVLAGIGDQPLLSSRELPITDRSITGGIVLVGSHVNKTTKQLEYLSRNPLPIECIEFNQHLASQEGKLLKEAHRVSELTNQYIKRGRNVLVYTNRNRLDISDGKIEDHLELSGQISDALTSIISNLDVRPRFIIAKGGITSSDVATKALKIERAVVVGQIQPGVSVWLTGNESLFPGMSFVVFPGNVGQEDTLYKIINEFTQ